MYGHETFPDAQLIPRRKRTRRSTPVSKGGWFSTLSPRWWSTTQHCPETAPRRFPSMKKFVELAQSKASSFSTSAPKLSQRYIVLSENQEGTDDPHDGNSINDNFTKIFCLACRQAMLLILKVLKALHAALICEYG
jgi:hypothetical protein